MNKSKNEIIAVIGAGPVGIAAAAHLLKRGLQPLVLEKGKSAGQAMQEWAHVKVFTPWKYITDSEVVSLLEKTSWQHPEKEHLPTAGEIVNEYLIPAATTTVLKDLVIYDAEVVSVSKLGLSKSSSKGRENAPFTVHYKTSLGEQFIVQASAVIDASGTWYNPNPIGTDGLFVAGEEENSNLITYGIPDVLDTERTRYEGKRTLILGGGHSAINAALDLLKLKENNANTKVYWGLRRNNLERLLGGGINDELPARGALGMAAKNAIEDGTLQLMAPFSVKKIRKTETGLEIGAQEGDSTVGFEVDRIVVAAGFRPDLHMLRELRLDVDVVVEAPSELAPLIDPNFHSCGTVPPHGIDELTHHDKNFFIVGMKAYGRAPTFLMLTGYEQVRSVADELAGKHEAARRIELVLPATGVCNSRPSDGGASCCAPAEEGADASCSPALEESELAASARDNGILTCASVENVVAGSLLVKQAATVSCCAPALEKQLAL